MDEKTIEESAELDRPITFPEFQEELKQMKSGAPGIEGVEVIALKAMSTKTQKRLFRIVVDHLEVNHNKWSEVTTMGWVIPLFKKGSRGDLNNYRGVCLLPLISRICARVLATRVRIWAENIGALGENQSGFRTSRSTCDATQIVLRVNEESRRVFGQEETATGERAGAVLLDIKKAYPRVNRPLLWRILQNLGMGEVTLARLKGLHEGTSYQVKGREALSESWHPERGLREGCATSPILFNVFHEQAIKIAHARRKASAEEKGQECGLEWKWRPGNSLPANDPKMTLRSSDSESFRITESLFADDSTLIGRMGELQTGKEIFKKSMTDFEERCHDGKEEFICFGTKGADKTRMLGTHIGRKEDRTERIKRANIAWAKFKRRLWKSKLSRRTKAVIVQAVVESTMLFDCQARSWTNTDLRKFQSAADKCYRFVWNDGKGLPKLRMQAEHTNSYNIRLQLEIHSIRYKVEKRALERVGHVLRMPDSRLTKRVVLGRWNEDTKNKKGNRDNIISYWKRIIREMGEDWTNIENLTSSRKEWKKAVNKRMRYIADWEARMAYTMRSEEKPCRSQTVKTLEEYKCRYSGCDKVCRSKTGLIQHERRIHRIKNNDNFTCTKCTKSFKEKHNLSNHEKTCVGGTPGECPGCGKVLAPSYIKKHLKMYCKNPPPQLEPTVAAPGPFTGNRKRKECTKCGAKITSNNWSRHLQQCGNF